MTDEALAWLFIIIVYHGVTYWWVPVLLLIGVGWFFINKKYKVTIKKREGN